MGPSKHDPIWVVVRMVPCYIILLSESLYHDITIQIVLLNSTCIIPHPLLPFCFLYQRGPSHHPGRCLFNAIADNDIPLVAPKEGDWRYSHNEKRQDLRAYKQINPIRQRPNHSTIYLMPVGDFTPLQQTVLKQVREYVEVFFQLRTVLMPAVADSALTSIASREHDGHTQLLAPYLLDSLLKDKCPSDGIAPMAISAKDLYPKNDWNYVFGLASYTKRIGVSSIYRLQDGHLDTTNYKTCLRRLANISSHEIGHMFSLHHCVYASCVMNGTNGLRETDRSPLRLCSECQKKLFWNIGYDNKRRLKQLSYFCKNNGLQGDWQIFKADLDGF